MRKLAHSQRPSLVTALTLASAWLFSPVVQAARIQPSIAWGNPTNISSDLDVVTTGISLYAYNIGTSAVTATTVNGVTFSAFAFSSDYTMAAGTNGDVRLGEWR